MSTHKSPGSRRKLLLYMCNAPLIKEGGAKLVDGVDQLPDNTTRAFQLLENRNLLIARRQGDIVAYLASPLVWVIEFEMFDKWDKRRRPIYEFRQYFHHRCRYDVSSHALKTILSAAIAKGIARNSPLPYPCAFQDLLAGVEGLPYA